MDKLTSVPSMREAAARWRQAGKRVALLPTLGALHAGHASLVKIARQHAEVVVVSAFVNPLQFGPSEDFARYPRTPEADEAWARAEGVDVLFTPEAGEMFPRGYSTHMVEETLSKALCGVARPGLFRGVLTCWFKLMHIIQPAVLVMGERDAQQVAVVRKAVADQGMAVEIRTGPTVREADGLVVSARNAYLTASQRTEAASVYAALQKAREMVASGVRSPDRLVAEATHIIAARRRLRVIYIALVDKNSMEPVRDVVPGQCLMAVSLWVDEVRLTDNMPL
jgi:pantoate--beta-alanine ligase